MTNRDHRHINRRDKLFAAANRMGKLTGVDAEEAWNNLSERLHELSEKDVPKFDDLYRAIRGATVVGSQKKDLESIEHELWTPRRIMEREQT